MRRKISILVMLVLSGLLTACAKSTQQNDTNEYAVFANLFGNVSPTDIADETEDTEGYAKQEAEAEGNEITTMLEVASKADIYSSPNKSASILGSVEEGESIEVIEAGNKTKWYRIVYNGRVAYVLSECVAVEKETETTGTMVNNTTTESVTQKAMERTTAQQRTTERSTTAAATTPAPTTTEQITEVRTETERQTEAATAEETQPTERETEATTAETTKPTERETETTTKETTKPTERETEETTKPTERETETTTEETTQPTEPETTSTEETTVEETTAEETTEEITTEETTTEETVAEEMATEEMNLNEDSEGSSNE